ncbi:hypothetical protein J8273_0769 [Carpediemonas membranifera]|uniref:Uncharacterized protein n=1 Tax=Carpediemonas membranifera TaxID=201153 RepID=A0A8J6BAP5_9EUKA|nr:hypothetical protein J8273_0769 [Carpediemonas membranifera]|eukprot:KAG9397639.1 hypothetical protein J8273_0769 [Carpediemonas membranifera]
MDARSKASKASGNVVKGMVPMRVKESGTAPFECNTNWKKREVSLRIRIYDIPRSNIKLRVFSDHFKYNAKGPDKDFEMEEKFPKGIRVEERSVKLFWTKGWLIAKMNIITAAKAGRSFKTVPEEPTMAPADHPLIFKRGRESGSKASRKDKVLSGSEIAALAASLAGAEKERVMSQQAASIAKKTEIETKQRERQAQKAATAAAKAALREKAEKAVAERLKRV